MVMARADNSCSIPCLNSVHSYTVKTAQEWFNERDNNPKVLTFHLTPQISIWQTTRGFTKKQAWLTKAPTLHPKQCKATCQHCSAKNHSTLSEVLYMPQHVCLGLLFWWHDGNIICQVGLILWRVSTLLLDMYVSTWMYYTWHILHTFERKNVYSCFIHIQSWALLLFKSKRLPVCQTQELFMFLCIFVCFLLESIRVLYALLTEIVHTTVILSSLLIAWTHFHILP